MMPMNYIRASELSQTIQTAVMMALHASQALNKTLPPAPITVYGLAVPAVHTRYEEQERKGAAISSIQRTRELALKIWSRCNYLDEAKNAYSDLNDELPTRASIDKPVIEQKFNPATTRIHAISHPYQCASASQIPQSHHPYESL
jgi:hypothetical protein